MTLTFRTKSQRWAMVLLTIMMMALPQMATATGVDNNSNYRVTPKGVREISIICPIIDKDGADCWVVDGKLQITVEGSTDKITVLNWKCNNHEKSGYSPCSLKTDIEGDVFVQVGKDFSEYKLTKGSQVNKDLYGEKDQNVYFVHARWVIPDKYIGKTLKFTWVVDRDGSARYHEHVKNISDFEFSVPEAPPCWR